MRFVPVKSVEQQALLAMHRVRQGFVVERTATINRLRGQFARPLQRCGGDGGGAVYVLYPETFPDILAQIF